MQKVIESQKRRAFAHSCNGLQFAVFSPFNQIRIETPFWRAIIEIIFALMKS